MAGLDVSIRTKSVFKAWANLGFIEYQKLNSMNKNNSGRSMISRGKGSSDHLHERNAFVGSNSTLLLETNNQKTGRAPSMSMGALRVIKSRKL
jgi:hypothetical protein